MIKENNGFYDFPLEKIKHNWPFDTEMSHELFWSNSLQKYSSLDEFLSDYAIDGSDDGITVFIGFFVENNKGYYQGLDDKKYTFKNVPYSLLISSAIKYELSPSMKGPNSWETGNWSGILNYLLFTTFPIKQILEEGQYMKSDKKEIFKGFFITFSNLQRTYKSKLKRFFSKKDCKERLLYILLYSEISKVEGIALVNKSFLTQDLSDIISYYREI